MLCSGLCNDGCHESWGVRVHSLVSMVYLQAWMTLTGRILVLKSGVRCADSLLVTKSAPAVSFIGSRRSCLLLSPVATLFIKLASLQMSDVIINLDCCADYCLSPWHKPKHTWVGRISMKEFLPSVACRQVWGCSLLLIDVGGSSPLEAMPSLGKCAIWIKSHTWYNSETCYRPNQIDKISWGFSFNLALNMQMGSVQKLSAFIAALSQMTQERREWIMISWWWRSL